MQKAKLLTVEKFVRSRDFNRNPRRSKALEMLCTMGAGSDFIKKAREYAGLTQKELGQRIGVPEFRLAWMESGRQRITLGMLFRIANVCGGSLILKFKPAK